MRLVAFGVAVALLAGGFGYWLGYQVEQGTVASIYAQFSPIRLADNSDPLIAPLLAYHAPEATLFGQYTALNTALQSAVTAATQSGSASRVSIYFRDLGTNAWLGINQNDTYYPASLLKVPVMIAYYKEAEADPDLLEHTLVYQNIPLPDPFDATSTLSVGQSYTIGELIDHMIINSDNGATFALLNEIDPTVLSQVYTDLGVADPGDNSGTYQISTRTYALFFRILYNATYLSPAYSEKALELLSHATFKDGLVAGVPTGTAIAHKFGEHVVSEDGTTVAGVELSDCGITYYPDHPYLLCVMTSAQDLPSATGIIKNISALTYAAIGQQYPESTKSSK